MSHQVTRQFEEALEKYTGAPFAVAVSSCTAAIELAVSWCKRTHGKEVVILPKRTYPSVPQVLIKAGYRISIVPIHWQGAYQLTPLPVWDSAKRFTEAMYVPGQMQCVSFHVAKILGDTQGGAILTDNEVAANWFRKMRCDGRDVSVPINQDHDIEIGWHCYMSPDVAARLLLKLTAASFKRKNDVQYVIHENEYPDLTKIKSLRPFLGSRPEDIGVCRQKSRFAHLEDQ